MEMRRKQAEEQRLRGLVAELADWFQSSLGLDPDIYADPGGYDKFFESLQTGLLLGQVLEKCTPNQLGTVYKFKLDARPGTFTARDNVCLFCESCGKLGVAAADVFEVEDLIGRKNDKAVVNCLLGLSRVGYARAGFKPPTIVQMEVEIDKEAAEEGGEIEESSNSNSSVNEKEKEEETGEEIQEGLYKPNKSDPIDVALAREINELGLNLDIRRIKGKSGVYSVSGKKVHMRILRGQLLVRVGGGWTDLLTFSQKATTTRALERQPSKKILTLATTSSIGEDGRGAQKESMEKKHVPLKTLVGGGSEENKLPRQASSEGKEKTSVFKPTKAVSPKLSTTSRSASPKPASRVDKERESLPSSSPLPVATTRQVSSPSSVKSALPTAKTSSPSSPSSASSASASSPPSSIINATTHSPKPVSRTISSSTISKREPPKAVPKDKYGNPIKPK